MSEAAVSDEDRLHAMFPTSYYTQTAAPSLAAMIHNLVSLMEAAGDPPDKQRAALDAIERPMNSDRFTAAFDGPRVDVDRAAAEYVKLNAAMVQVRAGIERTLNAHAFDARRKSYERAQARILADIWIPSDFKARLAAYKARFGRA